MPLRSAIGISFAMSGGPSSGGGSTRSGAGSPTFAQKAVEVEGPEADQRLGLVGLGDEGVRDALGAEGERAGPK